MIYKYKKYKLLIIFALPLIVGSVLAFGSFNKYLPAIPITQIILSYDNPVPLFDIRGNIIILNSNYKLNVSSIVANEVNASIIYAKEFCIGADCITSWPSGGIVFTWFISPSSKFEKKCVVYNGNEICTLYASLCTRLCGEGNPTNCIPGNKSDGSYYTCSDVLWEIDLDGDGDIDYTIEDLGIDPSTLTDSDGDKLVELKAEKIPYPNKIIYSRANMMVEIVP